MNRSQRRAAMRLTNKATVAFPAPEKPIVIAETVVPESLVHTPTPMIETAPVTRPVSDAQLSANRANAKLSTGAKTEAGKVACSHNAVKTALTGRTILLPTDDVASYEKLGKIFIDQYKPATYEEDLLVQSLIDAQWRLMRIPTLESGVFAMGRRELAATVPAETLEIEIYLKHEHTLKNLGLQENRLRRNQEKDRARLTALQAARLECEAIQRKTQQAKQQQQQQSRPQLPAEIGFEFSIPEFPSNLTSHSPAMEAA